MAGSQGVMAHLSLIPVPHDTRCGCVFCPDCSCTTVSNKSDGLKEVVPHPCANCDGTCVVCIGVVSHSTAVSVHQSGRLAVAL